MPPPTRLSAGLVAIVCVTAAAGCGGTSPTTSGTPPAAIKHVFTIVLENRDYSETFGERPGAPYLANKLVPKGVLLSRYFATGHNSLGNYITLISGQSENRTTQRDCPVFTPLKPGSAGPEGQAVGDGCVYPARFQTIADQLEGAGLNWRAYMEDMGDDPERDGGTACAHPQIGSPDPTGGAEDDDQYAVRHNPFMYFRSVIDDSATCEDHVVNLDQLTADLADASRTPSYSFIGPDLCSDGHDERCADPTQPGGYAGINDFLRTWVPRILDSPAYAEGGLLLILFDESDRSGDACCFVPHGPNVKEQGIVGPGGGRTGALILSPAVAPGVDRHRYNDYDTLATVEDLFGLDRLGYAADPKVQGFADLFGTQ